MRPNENTPRSFWPMRADHITSDGESLGLDGWGIITNRELQGYQSEISSEVGHATTIIEFTLDGQTIRTDSPFINLAMHPACRIFRQNNLHTNEKGEVQIDEKTKRPLNGALCYQCDQCHAQLFYGLAKNALTPETIIHKKKKDSRLKALYSSTVDCHFEPKFHDEKLYLEYDCPLLGFRELLFPVILQERVLAVFFIGQLTIERNTDFIQKMIGDVEHRFPGCFKHAGQSNVIQAMQGAQEKWIKQQTEFESHSLARIITKELYENTIKTTFAGISNLQRRLDDAFTHRRHEYIRESIVNAPEMKDFSKSARLSKDKNTEDVIDDTPLIGLWDEFEKSLNHIVNRFSLRYALAFGLCRIFNIEDDIIKVQAKAGKWEEVFSQETLNNLHISISRLPKDEGYIVCSPTQDFNKKYLTLLCGCDIGELGDFQLVLLPIPQHPSSSIAILIGFTHCKDITMSNLPEHGPNRYLHQTLKAFFSLAVLAVATIRTKGLEELAKKQLLYLGHESGQLTAGLNWLIKFYEDAHGLVDKLRRQNPYNKNIVITGLRKKIEDLCADMQGYSGQMLFVFDIAERLGSDIRPEVDLALFRPYGDVLAKWKDTYRHECDRKRLQVRVESPELVDGSRIKDPLRPVIWGDRFLFEQVVYNLMNNAEKYCYRGTKIDMDCKLAHLDGGAPHVLTITDYGLPIDPKDDSIFLPFMRGKGSEEVTAGLGLGLYVVRIIAVNMFNGKVEVLCDNNPISKFNVPLIKPYVQQSFKGKDETLIPELREELTRLERTKQYDSIIAYEPGSKRVPRYQPQDVTIKNEIYKATYKVTIKAEIPMIKDMKGEK